VKFRFNPAAKSRGNFSTSMPRMGAWKHHHTPFATGARYADSNHHSPNTSPRTKSHSLQTITPSQREATHLHSTPHQKRCITRLTLKHRTSLTLASGEWFLQLFQSFPQRCLNLTGPSFHLHGGFTTRQLLPIVHTPLLYLQPTQRHRLSHQLNRRAFPHPHNVPRHPALSSFLAGRRAGSRAGRRETTAARNTAHMLTTHRLGITIVMFKSQLLSAP